MHMQPYIRTGERICWLVVSYGCGGVCCGGDKQGTNRGQQKERKVNRKKEQKKQEREREREKREGGGGVERVWISIERRGIEKGDLRG